MAFTASQWGQGQLLTGLSPVSTESGFVTVITKDSFPSSAFDTGSTSCLNGGGDWRFSTDINGVNQVPCEIVTCVTSAVPASVEFVAWVRFPTYSSANREVYAFWNKAGETQPLVGSAFGRNAVWPDRLAYFHHEESPSGSPPQMVDSTGNGNDATTTGMGAGDLVGGEIGEALRFSGASYTSKANNSTLDIGTNDFCASAWINFDSSAPTNHSARVFNTAGAGAPSNKNGFQLKVRRDGSTNNWYLSDCSVSDGVNGIGSGEDSLIKNHSLNAWYHIAMVYDRTAEVTRGYVNGVLDHTFINKHAGAGVLGSLDSANDLVTGASIFTNNAPSAPSQHFYGEIDEVSLEVGQPSEQNINTRYNNQSNPATFWTAGSVFVPGGAGVDGNAAFTFTKPTFSAAGSATLPQPDGSAAFDISSPTFIASGAATLPQPSGAASFNIVSPLFSGAGSATLPNPTAAGDFDIAKPVFLGAGSATLPNPTGIVVFDVSMPTFSGTGSATLPGNVVSGAFDISKPSFSGAGSATLPQPVGVGSFEITSPAFNGVGSVTGIDIKYADDAISIVISGDKIAIVTSGDNIAKI